MVPLSRRRFLAALGAVGLLAGTGAARAQLQPRPRFDADPFSLGVASGYPLPAGVVLWTRLAPVPQAPGGGMPPEVIPVQWQVARDERMREVVASGTAYATPEWAHSVHVEVQYLEPGRWYWYRFTAGEAASPVGRTRTAPAPNREPGRLRFAAASCQQFEQGYFGAYAHMLKDDLDLIVFLGDYIYESSWGRDHVRSHNAPEPRSLEDYRIRHALYKSDPDLREGHAACPWIVTWDDHEVQNDYANDRSETLDAPEWFLARRAAAYKAFYEHMPLRRGMLPLGPHARIHTRVAFGRLAMFHVLDDRQYRSAQACPRPGRGGGNTLDIAECPALEDPSRTMLGADQENWLAAGLSSSRARWNILAQQTLMAQFDRKPGEGRSAWTDGWDGYPAARRRLIDHLARARVANPVVLGGDVHHFCVCDLKRDFDAAASDVVASEFVGTSITSQSWPQEAIDRFLPDNPHVKLADSRYRGYLRMEVTPRRLVADLRAMQTVSMREAPCNTLATFVVEDGRPGPQRA